MNRIFTAGLILGVVVCTTSAGTKALMTQAERDLREVNAQVLKKVPQDKIPETGKIIVKAKVKSTKPDPEITHLQVQTISSNVTAKSKQGTQGK